MSLSREPCAVKAARTGLTGGLGRRAVRERALILPTKAVHTGREEYKKPKGEVRQVSHGKDATVRERRTAETILNILQDRGKRQLPLDDVYRQLYNPDMSLRSYARL